MRDRATIYMMVAPSAVIVFVVFLFPLLLSLWTSLHLQILSRPELTRFIGLDNYLSLAMDPEFQHSVKVTLILGVAVVIGPMMFGLPIALLLEHHLGHLGWVRALYLLPIVVTPVVAAIQWRWMLNPSFGVLTWLLQSVGLPGGEVLKTPIGAIFWLIVVDIWSGTPIVILLFAAGLESISVEIRDAAKVDGASGWQTARYILLPMLRQLLVVILLIRTIAALRGFDTIKTLTDGGPGNATEVVNLLAFRAALEYWDVGKASAMGWIMLFVAVVLTITYARLMGVGTKTE